MRLFCTFAARLQVVSERLFSTPRSSTSSLTGSEEGVELRDVEVPNHHHGDKVFTFHFLCTILVCQGNIEYWLKIFKLITNANTINCHL